MPLHGCKLLRGVKVELNENHLRIAWIIKSTLNYWSSSCRVSRLAKDWEYPIKDLPIVKYREKKKKNFLQMHQRIETLCVTLMKRRGKAKRSGWELLQSHRGRTSHTRRPTEAADCCWLENGLVKMAWYYCVCAACLSELRRGGPAICITQTASCFCISSGTVHTSQCHARTAPADTQRCKKHAKAGDTVVLK